MFTVELIINGEVLYQNAETGEFVTNPLMIDNYNLDNLKKVIQKEVKAYKSLLIVSKYDIEKDEYEMIHSEKIYNEGETKWKIMKYTGMKIIKLN